MTARSGNETGRRGTGADQQRREAATNLQPAPQPSDTADVTVMGRELGKQLASLRQAAGAAAGAAAWRQACGDGEPAFSGRPDPSAFPLSTAGTDIHIWFTTSEGITHWLTIPRASASPELLARTLGRMLGMDQQ